MGFVISTCPHSRKEMVEAAEHRREQEAEGSNTKEQGVVEGVAEEVEH